MAALSTTQLRRFISQQVALAHHELERLRGARTEHGEQLQKTKLEMEEAWQSLLATLLPSLDAQNLARAGARVHLPALAFDCENLRERRRTELSNTLARCADEPDVRNRDALALELSMALSSLAESIKPLTESVDPVRLDLHWDELLTSNYGTNEYAVPFWRLSYFRHWKHADELVERHGAMLGVSNFADLRRKHLQEAHALQTLLDNQQQLQARQSRLEALEREEAEAAAGLQSLPAWTLATARGLLRAQLQDLADADFIALMDDEPALRLGAKRVLAVAAKCRYLEAIAREWLSMPEHDLLARIKKLERNLEKFARPKNAGLWFPEEEVRARYGFDTRRWDARWQRYHATTHSIIVFHDYDAYNPVADLIWWDVMTGGHVKAHFIPEVNDVYRSHHHHHAYAAVAEERDQRDDALLYTDAS